MTRTPLADIVQEAQRILDVADQNNITLRLFGGLAVRLHCPSATHRNLQRKYADIDFMALKKQSRGIKILFGELGYIPRDMFNRLQGDRRLIFNDLEMERRVDVFLDVFEMCHRFDFKDRIELNKATIPLADLLATKLQVVEITEREYRDVMALVQDHEIGDTDDAETINGTYLANLCADDWGIYKTFLTNIANIASTLPNYKLGATEQDIISKRLRNLQARIDTVPKTLKWKMRARIGEKKRWYELPEQDKEVVDGSVSLTEDDRGTNQHAEPRTRGSSPDGDR